MSSCPSESQIHEFLVGGVDSDHIASHLDSCEACAHLIERMCKDMGNDWLHQTTFAQTAAEGAGDRFFLSQLARNPPEQQFLTHSNAASTTVSEVPKPESLKFPGPPTSRGPLGTIGSYQITEKIGRGGFGDVYLAYDSKFSRQVAIKLLRLTTFERDSLARIKREAQSLGKIRHANVVTIFDMIEPTADFPYACLVMEFIPGGSLQKVISSNAPSNLREIVEWVVEAAKGLSAVHEKGIIHRDIKPGNLLVDENNKVKVADFGLARPTDTEGDVSHSIVGTPLYMSPEQIETPEKVDGRTDIYSLGVVLYELLTGSRPFHGKDSALRQQIIHDEPPSPRKLNPRLPLDLETITLRCLQKEPGRRFKTANDLATDLQNWLHDRPIASRPIGVLGKARLWAKRKPSLAALWILTVATAVASISAAVWVQKLRKSAEQSAVTANEERNRSLDVIIFLVTKIGGGAGSPEELEAVYQFCVLNLEQMSTEVDTSPEVPYTRAIAHLRLGEIYSTLAGALEKKSDGVKTQPASTKSQEHYRIAEEILVKLPGDHRRELVATYDGLGSLYDRNGDVVAAKQFFEQALTLTDSLLSEDKNNLDLARGAAVEHEALGNSYLTSGNIENCLRHYRLCLELREKIVNSENATNKAKSELGTILYLYGDALKRSSRESAVPHYLRAVTLFESIVESEPQNSEFLRGLANIYGRMASNAHSEESLSFAHKAFAIREATHRTEPQNRSSIRDLVTSYLQLNQLTTEPLEAKKWLDKALELGESWARNDNRDVQSQYLLSCGLLSLAEWYKTQNDSANALKSALRSVELRKKANELSQSAETKSWLAVAFVALANFQNEADDVDGALESWGAAIEQLQQLKESNQFLPNNEEWLAELIQLRCSPLKLMALKDLLAGDLDTAMKRLAQIVADAGQNKDALLSAARNYGECATYISPPSNERFIAAGRAVLEQAIQCGWNDFDAIDHDEFLTSLKKN